MNNDSDIDRLIDGALSAYSDREPMAGLERRILNRIRTAETRRRRSAWFLGFAFASTLFALVLIGIRTHHQDSREIAASRPAAPTRVAPSYQPPPAPRESAVAPKRI